MGVIYSLSLSDGDIRYVGMTTKTAEARLTEHCRAALNGEGFHLHRWMRKHGPLNVVTTVLETVPERADLPLREIHWIAEMKAQGCRLTNCSDGGDGLLNPAPYITAARVAANKRRFEDPEARALVGRLWSAHTREPGYEPWNKGKEWPDETRQRISEGVKRTGWVPTESARKAWSEAAKGNQYGAGKSPSPEVRAVLAERSREMWERKTPEQREHASQSSKKAMHVRWHVKRGLVNDSCAFCQEDVQP